MSKIIYPLAKETINSEDVQSLIAWLQTYPRLTKGEQTLEVERKWAEYIGTKYAVFCNSGSSANLLMAYAAKISKPRNMKVVVPSVGWVTTVAPFMQFGFEPIMIGADERTFGIDLDELERVCIEQSPATVIFVQVLGVPHYKERLLELAEKYDFILLEDACAALGASYEDGTKVGTVGDMSSFSFYFGHQLSTIEGGMVNTDDFETYQNLLMLRSHGWGKDLDIDKYEGLVKENDVDDFHKPFTFFVPGFNVRATDLQAFIGIKQIDKADWVSSRRNKNHLRYAENLRGYVRFQEFDKNTPVSISFGALADNKEQRTRIVKQLVEHGIETRIFSAGNLGRHPFWRDVYGAFENTMSDKIHSCGFFVPNYPELTEEQVDFICNVIKGAI
jgi:CDP-6-deoxy-D-xylo-4-hexulose-3-dehydrase